jgi:CRP/FNR family transcriptional regulator
MIELPLSREELAEMSATTIETTSRIISSMQRDGIVESGRKWVSILQSDRLRALAGGK